MLESRSIRSLDFLVLNTSAAYPDLLSGHHVLQPVCERGKNGDLQKLQCVTISDDEKPEKNKDIQRMDAFRLS